MNERKIGFDIATLDSKIIIDDDKYLVMPAVIASEIVHQYEDGWAYKPADEIERMTSIANDIGSVPVKILEHPGPETNYLLVRQADVQGRAENFQFVKNLIDSKTGRPMRRGTKADIRWFKDRVPTEVIEKIKTGNLHDVSIGFTFDVDQIQGDFNGVHYDYVQRNIYLNHVAAPIESGRCPGPVCGIGYDFKTTADPWETTEEYIRSGHKESGSECRTIDISEEQGIKAIYCKYGDKWDVQSFLFTKEKWDLEKAKSWFTKHKGDAVDDPEMQCPICQAIREVGLLTVAKRLSVAYGQDVLSIIRELPPQKPNTSLDEEFKRTFGRLTTILRGE